jgi:hypothetical protein
MADQNGGQAFRELPEHKADPNFVVEFNKRPGTERKQFLVELRFKHLAAKWNRGAFNFVPLLPRR